MTTPLPLPSRPFDPCVLQPAQVDKYQTVHFDRNRYSVPRLWAFRAVTVKGYVDQVVIVAEDQVIARHPRCYERGQQILDPLHYLAVLGRKPAALDHTNVFRHWELPAIFDELRRGLEAAARRPQRRPAVHSRPAVAGPASHRARAAGRGDESDQQRV